MEKVRYGRLIGIRKDVYPALPALSKGYGAGFAGNVDAVKAKI